MLPCRYQEGQDQEGQDQNESSRQLPSSYLNYQKEHNSTYNLDTCYTAPTKEKQLTINEAEQTALAERGRKLSDKLQSCLYDADDWDVTIHYLRDLKDYFDAGGLDVPVKLKINGSKSQEETSILTALCKEMGSPQSIHKPRITLEEAINSAAYNFIPINQKLFKAHGCFTCGQSKGEDIKPFLELLDPRPNYSRIMARLYASYALQNATTSQEAGDIFYAIPKADLEKFQFYKLPEKVLQFIPAKFSQPPKPQAHSSNESKIASDPLHPGIG